MRNTVVLLIALAALMPLAGQPYGETPKPPRTLAEMEPVLAKIAAWDYGQSRAPLYDFSEFVQGALASPAGLREIESRLLRILESNQATLAGKDFACRQLSLIGTAASVPALAGMLARPETSDMARFALERIPGTAPIDALRKALPGASGKLKVGIINSLGQRRDTKSVPALKALMAAPDAGVSQAAAAALAAIGDRPALEALAAGRTAPGAARRSQVSEAYLRCAEKLAAAGNRTDALKAYRQLSAAGEPEMIRVTALGGLAALAAKESAPELERAMASPSPKVQAAAIRLLNGMPGAEITKLLVSRFAKLPPEGQVRIVAALGDRRDAAARPLVTEALKNVEPGVRRAALTALAGIGDGSSVMPLAEAAANTEGAEQNAARQSLYSLRGSDAEAAIVAGIGSAAGNTRLELIRAAGERGLSAAADALLRAARDPGREVRRESVRSLRRVAGPANAGALLALLRESQDASDRREAARALGAALRRSEPPPMAETIAAYRSAENAEIRAALLEVMGQVSGDEALPVLRGSLADTDPEIVRAGILALTEWLTSAPLPDLLALAKTSPNPAHQVLALRGYIRLISTASDRSPADTVALLAEAMRLAKQPDEKRAALSLLSNYGTREALQIAEAAAKDSAVSREAAYAIGRIRLALGAVK